jgi:peptidyl-prolyl cis-trans isomerase SurA
MMKWMKKNILVILFVMCTNSIYAIENKIVFKIKNEIITTIDIKNEYRYLLVLNKNLRTLSEEKIFNIAKESIAKETIKIIELKRNSIDFNTEIPYLDKVMESIYLNLNLKSIDDFYDYLKANDLKYNDIKEKIKIDILWNNLIISKYSSKIDINLEEIKKDINNKKLSSKVYLLSEIVFQIENKSDLNKRYNEIVESIRDTGFENTASIYSIADTGKTGGNIGWINIASLDNKIKKNIQQLNIGEITTPIIIPGGIMILKINNIKEEFKKINFDLELKKAISFEKNRQLNQYSNIYFNKTKKNFNLND